MSDLKRFAIYSSVSDPCGFEMKPQEDGDYVKFSDLNKIKADAVQKAIDYADGFAKDQHDWVERINGFADKLERGDV